MLAKLSTWYLILSCLCAATVLCNAAIPERGYYEQITGYDKNLNLNDSSLCNNLTENIGIEFQRLLLADDTLYVGATNHILQINISSFTISHFALLGPYQDDPHCIAPNICPDAGCSSLRCTDNNNRLLVAHRDQLLVCGSIFAGTCDLLKLSNVAEPYEPNPGVTELKCHPESKITSDNITVASLYENSSDPKRDLLYVGSSDRIMTYFPPESEVSNPAFMFQKIDQSSDGKKTFIISWVTETHAYMLWTRKQKQKKPPGGMETLTYLSRYCHTNLNTFNREKLSDQEDYNSYGRSSYVHTQITCGGGFTEATLAYYGSGPLHVLFKNNGGKRRLCSVLLNQINAHIEEARKSCFDGEIGNDAKAQYVINRDRINCKKVQNVSSEMITCGLGQEMYTYTHAIECKNALEMKKVYIWPNNTDQPVTFAVHPVNGFFSGFFGTANGTILKARLDMTATDFVEKIILEDGFSVKHDIEFDRSRQYLYAMNYNKLFKVKLSNCNQYTTCQSCLSSNDPYCGWCVLQSSCTQMSECPDSVRETHWRKTNANSQQCSYVSAIQPSSLPVVSSEKLMLSFGGNTFPTFAYQCEFVVNGEVIFTSKVENFGSSPACQSPSNPPTIPEGEDHVKVSLLIKALNAVVAAGSLPMYDCNRIPQNNQTKMCTSCLGSQWDCSWCSVSDTCSNRCDAVSDAPIPGIDGCPVVVQVQQKDLDIPTGKYHEFVLETNNLPQDHNFTCVLDICDSAHKAIVPGIQDGDRIKCQVHGDRLYCPRQDSSVLLSLRSEHYVIDTKEMNTVTVGLFNCSGSQAECGLCMSAHRIHSECGWCDGIQMCVPQVDCPAGALTNVSLCPPPVIKWINPPHGPLEGGTEVLVEGRNLGSRPEDISSVTIGGMSGQDESVDCVMIAEKYLPSKRIVCQTTKADNKSIGGPVKLKMTYRDDPVVSQQSFTFRKVLVDEFRPHHALNGTKITITGQNLQIGNGAKVKVEKGSREYFSDCSDRSKDQMICRLNGVDEIGHYSVSVLLDGFKQTFPGKLEFVTMPEITDLIGRKKLKSFYSGGLQVTFLMSSLLGIQQIVLQINNGEESSDCLIRINSTAVICHLPAMNPTRNVRWRRSIDDENEEKAAPRIVPMTVSAELLINDRFSLPLEGDKLSMSYVPDPIVEAVSVLPCHRATGATRQPDPKLSGNYSSYIESDSSTSEPMTAVQLTGKYLDYAAVEKDYSVEIALVDSKLLPVNCIVDFLESESLICRTPTSILADFEGSKVQVMVKVGNLTFELPGVDYCPGTSQLSVVTIGVVVAIVLILVAIIIVLMVCNRQRAKKQQKEREQIMSMLDTLENKTREHARKAYFELQLGYMTTLTDNLSDRITYISPVACFMRALFNDSKEDHPMINNKATNGNTDTSGIDEFILLLKNRDFLMTFIRTLEEQKHFTVQENIMFELLSELIQKHINKNPKLLLRRSESVVEKMVSHWLCINLYSQCIKDQAGKPLFLLTKAIHFLVTSAPCDVIANKAVNSLNEMTLLGTEVTYEAITLQASVIEEGKRSESFNVKVVNCDTITQVKAKIIEAIYKDRPYSECPIPDDMELEIVAGKAHVVLCDIDDMNHHEGNYTRINTLKHYNIPDGSQVLLRPATELITDDETSQNCNGKDPLMPEKKRLYHLIHPRDDEMRNGFVEEEDATRGNKTKKIIGKLIDRPFQEIYLTRMVKSKTTVQEYVDGVFNAILSPDPIPQFISYFFQFLDLEAAKHKINDPEVLHIWKTNSLLLRYWVNILKNPEFLFDVNKTVIVDSCLNVITQAFMDACTTSTHKLGQESPSNKLLYAKDAARYREMVKSFFEEAANEKLITDEEINQSLMQVSKKYASEFNKRAAAVKLYSYFETYKAQVSSENENYELSIQLDQVFTKLSPNLIIQSKDTTVV